MDGGRDKVLVQQIQSQWRPKMPSQLLFHCWIEVQSSKEYFLNKPHCSKLFPMTSFLYFCIHSISSSCICNSGDRICLLSVTQSLLVNIRSRLCSFAEDSPLQVLREQRGQGRTHRNYGPLMQTTTPSQSLRSTAHRLRNWLEV